ncbi:MAG: ROK family protein [Microbacterium sp.]
MPSAAGELGDLRRRNLSRVAMLVRDHPRVHLSAVAETTGLAMGAVSSLVNTLVEAEILEDHVTAADGVRGRPRRTLTLADRSADLVAARITRTRIEVSAATLSGRLLASEGQTSTSGWSVAEASGILAQTVARVTEGRRRPGRSPRVVISIPGGETATAFGSEELDWSLDSSLPVLEPLRAEGFAASHIGNDGSLATLSEWRLGAARGLGNAVVILLGRGLGGSAIVDGRLIRGAMTAPGFGHTPVVRSGPVCACGRRGCIELYASLQSIALQLGEADRLSRMPSAAYARELDERARTGEAPVLDALTGAKERLSDFIEMLDAVLSPEVVVVSGQSAILTARLVESRLAMGAPIVRGELGDDAPLVGALLAAQEDALEDPLAIVG